MNFERKGAFLTMDLLAYEFDAKNNFEQGFGTAQVFMTFRFQFFLIFWRSPTPE